MGHDFGGACIAYAMELFPFRIAKAIFIAAAMLSNGQNTSDMFSQQVSLLICCLICDSEIQILKLLVLESIAYVFGLFRSNLRAYGFFFFSFERMHRTHFGNFLMLFFEQVVGLLMDFIFSNCPHFPLLVSL